MTNITTIYYTNTEAIANDEKLLNTLLYQLPSEMQGRANRYRFNKDKANYIAGRLLIKKGLEKGGLDSLFTNIIFTEKGKPTLPKIDFNISHSGQIVVCAFSENGAVGADIELIKPIDLNDFNRFFMAKEMADIQAAEDPLLRFYWYWTRKESIIKALGVDLGYLHEVEINPTNAFFLKEKEKWYLQDFQIEKNYIGALCTKFQSQIKLIMTSPNDLLEIAGT